jgi:hypothetical protein
MIAAANLLTGGRALRRSRCFTVVFVGPDERTLAVNLLQNLE